MQDVLSTQGIVTFRYAFNPAVHDRVQNKNEMRGEIIVQDWNELEPLILSTSP